RRDVTHPGAAVRLMGRGAPMSEAIVEMPGKGFGCVAVVEAPGKLAGVITDGDLRRHMRADLLQAAVDAVMTASPKTIRPDQLASEALQLLNESKITALIVVEADRPVGIVHFHDLLRAGVAGPPNRGRPLRRPNPRGRHRWAVWRRLARLALAAMARRPA